MRVYHRGGASPSVIEARGTEPRPLKQRLLFLPSKKSDGGGGGGVGDVGADNVLVMVVMVVAAVLVLIVMVAAVVSVGGTLGTIRVPLVFCNQKIYI